jgi:Holliday junction resolvasome RuvABC endonuclease subunit
MEERKDKENSKDIISVKSLSLARNQLNDEGIKEIIQIIQAKRIKIETMNFSKNQLSKLSLVHLRGFLESGTC